MKLSRHEQTVLTWLKNGQHIGFYGETDDFIIESLVQKGLVTVKYHPETDYTSIALSKIKVRINVAGTNHSLEMEFAGIGAYPYPCIAKDKYPHDAIYKCEHGSWISLRQYDYDPKTGEHSLPYVLI